MRLGAFEIGTCFATGGMGQVWKGKHIRHQTPVAIKVMMGPTASSDTFRTSFKREVQATAKLDHPGIVDVYDFGLLPQEARSLQLVPETPYFVMEFVKGMSPLLAVRDWFEIKHVLVGILQALAHAHSHGVIHRDIKPDNVIVERFARGLGRVVVTDFGVSHALERNTSTQGEDLTERSIEEVSGTPLYMAPEQFRGEFRDYGPGTDLYAVGIMAWQLICGSPPYQGQNPYKLARLHMQTPIPELNPQFAVPDGIADWVKSLTQKEVFKRPDSAARALEELWRLEDPDDLRATTEGQSASATTNPSSFDFDDVPTMFVPTEERSEPESSRVRPPADDWREAAAQNGPLALRKGLGLLALKTVPVTGRHTERDAIWKQFVDAWETRIPHTMVIRGLAGTGKTRLAQWLCQLADETGHARIFQATHQPEPGRMHGLGWMLRQHFRAAGLSGENLLNRVRLVLDRQGVRDDFEVRALAEMMREDIAQKTEHPIPTTQMLLSIDQRFELVRRVLVRAAEDRLAIVWLDDGIFDREATSLIEYIHNHDEDTPVLFILTVRDESLDEEPRRISALAGVQSREHVETLNLDFMDSASFDALIQNGLGVRGQAADILRERCDGSPLFATQLVDFWLAQGFLTEEDGNVVLNDPSASLPGDISALWESRLKHLVETISGARQFDTQIFAAPVPEQAVWRRLEFAAGLGRDVDGGEWEHVCELASLPAVPGLVEALIDGRLAEPRDRGFSFVHGLLRDFLRNHSIEQKRWKRSNLMCARMLTSRYDQNHPGLSARVARHFMEGGQLPLAQMCLVEALERERSTGLHSRVADVCEMLENTLKRSNVPDDDGIWVEVYGAHGRALLESSRGHDVATGRELLERAVQIGRQTPPTAAFSRALAGLGLSYVGLSMAVRGLPLAKEGVESAPDDETRGECLLEMAEIYQGLQNHILALESAEIALALVTHPVRRARADLLIARALLALDHPDTSKVIAEGLQLSEEFGFFIFAAQFHTLAGFVADAAGDFEKALDEHQNALRIYKLFEPEANLALEAAEHTARALLQLKRADEALTILLQLERRLVGEDRHLDSQIYDAMMWASAAVRNWTHFERAYGRAFDFERSAPGMHHARAFRMTMDVLATRGEDARMKRVALMSLETLEGAPGLEKDWQYFRDLQGL